MLGCRKCEGVCLLGGSRSWLGALVKGAFCVLAAGALFCGACAAIPVPSLVEYVSPEGQPAGYYPGLGTTTALKSELAEYLAKNRDGIADVQSRIVQIRNGQRAPGCIGEDKYTCVATLAQRLVITDDAASKDFNLFADARYDVNGRPVNGSHVLFDGFIPNHRDIAHRSLDFTVVLGSGGAVSSVEAKLLNDVVLAKTQADYDTTGAYEVVAAMSAKQCPGLSKSEVARWVENKVKPGMRERPEEHGRKAKVDREMDSIEGVHHFHLLESSKISLCGRTFQFSSAAFIVRHGSQHDPSVVPVVLVQ